LPEPDFAIPARLPRRSLQIGALHRHEPPCLNSWPQTRYRHCSSCRPRALSTDFASHGRSPVTSRSGWLGQQLRV
jgi:hypothetical protein